MTFRSLLLAGAVVPLALSAPSFAADPLPGNGFVLAQADCPEGADCPPAEELTREERREQRRQERREQRRQERMEERQQEDASEAEEPPAEQQATPEPESAPEQQAAPQQQEAAPEQQATPEITEEERQQRRERRLQRQEERAQQAEEQEQAPEQQATPEADQAPELTREERLERRERRRALREQRQQEEQATPDAGETPREDAAEQAGDPQERAVDRARRRAEELRQREQSGGQPADQAGAGEPEGESTVERQLEAQGDDRQAERIRELRERLREERRQARRENRGDLRDDVEERQEDQEERQEDRAEQREDRQERQEDRAERRDDRDEGRIVERRGDRVIIDLGGRVIVRPEFPDERVLYGARDVDVEYFPDGRSRTIVYRENGAEIITVRDRYDNIIRRVRRTSDGREIVLIDNRYPETGVPVIYQPIQLPPLVVNVPRQEYIVDYGQASPQQIEEVLLAPPVETVERAYTLDEVTQNERVRDIMSRIDLDTITFDFGSATIGYDQMLALEELGFAMEDVLFENPDEVYLIEGHTDAVGSDYDNLILSDQRAEAVAVALSQNFDIPPENLVTEGYGEQYLKVPTEAPERQNRRVTVRRITPLLTAEGQ